MSSTGRNKQRRAAKLLQDIRDRTKELIRVPVRDVHPHPRNFRTHPAAQRAAFRELVREVGFADAILAYIASDGRLVAINGHLRLEEMPPDSLVPVVVVDVTDDEAELLLSTIDPLSAMATTNFDALAALTADLRLAHPGLRDVLAELAQAEPARPTWADRADTYPDLSEEPRTKPGDLWLLGAHRVLCGDATKVDDVARVMGGELAVLFHTDPPYLVNYRGNDRPSGGKDWSDLYHEIDITDAAAFYRSVFTNAMGVLTDDAAWYCWHAHRHATLIESIWIELDVLPHQQLIWKEPTLVHGYSYYPWAHEPCLMGWQRGHKPHHDGDNASVTSVWEIDWAGSARPVGLGHPTSKPVALFEIPMRKHTRPAEICFEPFCGSGSQILAAEALGRRCFAIEIEPRFCDVAVARYEELTGTAAVLEEGVR